MVDHSEIGEGGSMSPDNNNKRSRTRSFKFRLCKKMIRMSNSKYDSIEDSDIEIHRGCLIKNTLDLLRREARKEKLARYKARALLHSSPSYLSSSRSRSPSPPCDMEVADAISHYGQSARSLITALSDDEEDLSPPRKRRRLIVDEDDDEAEESENSHGDRFIDIVGDADEPQDVEDTQKLFREVDEDYTVENRTQSQSSSPSPNQQDTNYVTTLCNNTLCNNTNSTYPCSHSARIGSDLKSVVYQSLMTSFQ